MSKTENTNGFAVARGTEVYFPYAARGGWAVYHGVMSKMNPVEPRVLLDDGREVTTYYKRLFPTHAAARDAAIELCERDIQRADDIKARMTAALEALQPKAVTA